MLCALTEARKELENNDDLRVGILFGHGKHVTAGIEIALVGDMIIASENAAFSQLEAMRGIMPTGGATSNGAAPSGEQARIAGFKETQPGLANAEGGEARYFQEKRSPVFKAC